MRGRTPESLVLTKKDEQHLRELLRHGDTALRVARRARILLERAQGSRPNAVERMADQDRATVWRVCVRYRSGGLDAALYDAPRSGRRPVFPPRRSTPDRTLGRPSAE